MTKVGKRREVGKQSDVNFPVSSKASPTKEIDSGRRTRQPAKESEKKCFSGRKGAGDFVSVDEGKGRKFSSIMSDRTGEEPDTLFKRMTGSGVKAQHLSSKGDPESSDNLCLGNGSVDFPSIDSSCFIDNASVDTASIDNNGCQDSLSVGNSSINVSMDLQDASESTLDLQEITQSILDLEGTQTSRHSSEYGTNTELQGITQVPSSPPPSYEHVLAETRLAQQAAHEESSREGETDESSDTVPEPLANVPPKKGIEIMHKSHKEFYKAVAKQWGITCKMSDHCRCLDCQSMYFDCEYDYNEQEKTDGGLGAGTPMFISEVMHGTACTLL